MTQTARPMQSASGTMFIVAEACAFSADRRAGKIVIQSTDRDFPRAIEALGSAEARMLALGYAAGQGIGDARINGLASAPYAVNDDDIPLDEVHGPSGQPLEPTHLKKQPAAYRVDVPVCCKLTA